jgi:hypothetical protein
VLRTTWFLAKLRRLKEIGVNEISLGVESGDDWTLQRINKGYTSQDILLQSQKLEEAGIQYWMTFLNGVAGREHSHEHAVNSAKIYNQCKPMLVGTGGLTLFPGTPPHFTSMVHLTAAAAATNQSCSYCRYNIGITPLVDRFLNAKEVVLWHQFIISE